MRYYKVIKDHPYWEVGAIIKGGDGDNYCPTDDLFLKDIDGLTTGNYVEDVVVENSPDFFERVYQVSVLKRVKYLSKADARKVTAQSYKD